MPNAGQGGIIIPGGGQGKTIYNGGAPQDFFPPTNNNNQCTPNQPGVQFATVGLDGSFTAIGENLIDFPVKIRGRFDMVRVNALTVGYAGGSGTQSNVAAFFSFTPLNLVPPHSTATAIPDPLVGAFPLIYFDKSGIRNAVDWKFCSPLPPQIYVTMFNSGNGAINLELLFSSDVESVVNRPF